jgi:hypothetical protein
VQAAIFQYRTHLVPPKNASITDKEGTPISQLSTDVRNIFTVKDYKVYDETNRTG